VVAVVFLYHITILFNKTQHHQFWTLFNDLMPLCYLSKLAEKAKIASINVNSLELTCQQLKTIMNHLRK